MSFNGTREAKDELDEKYWTKERLKKIEGKYFVLVNKTTNDKEYFYYKFNELKYWIFPRIRFAKSYHYSKGWLAIENDVFCRDQMGGYYWYIDSHENTWGQLIFESLLWTFFSWVYL